MAIEIVDLPIENGDFPYSYVTVYQKLPHFKPSGLVMSNLGFFMIFTLRIMQSFSGKIPLHCFSISLPITSGISFFTCFAHPLPIPAFFLAGERWNHDYHILSWCPYEIREHRHFIMLIVHKPIKYSLQQPINSVKNSSFLTCHGATTKNEKISAAKPQARGAGTCSPPGDFIEARWAMAKALSTSQFSHLANRWFIPLFIPILSILWN